MAQQKKKRSKLFWSVLGTLVLIVGAFTALFFYGREHPPASLSRLKIIQDFVGQTVEKTVGSAKDMVGKARDRVERMQEPPPPPTPAPMAPGEARSYQVRKGDNLWDIASKGDLVDSPWEWRTILIQNKDKIDYASVSAEDGRWRVKVEPGEVLTVRHAEAPAPSEPVKKKYAVQLVSLEEHQLDRGLEIVKALLADGRYAYLYRTRVKGKAWYRIRSGFFTTKAEAEQAGDAIRERFAKRRYFSDPYWVMLPSDRELRGELLQFGAQRAKPWVIELRNRPSRQMALEDLRKVSDLGTFAYISRRPQDRARSEVFRTRVGFFATREEATAVYARARREIELNWDNTGVAELQNFAELLPGQHVRLPTAKR